MKTAISDTALDQLFLTARTEKSWTDETVPESLIRQTYDLMKLGPTSMNSCPARFIFIGSDDGKERLKPHLAAGNVDKTMAAPWVVIIAHDLSFPDKMAELVPHNPKAGENFADPIMRAETAFRNGSLQGAYLMMAARALGLDCGPMSGFNRAGVDKEFFSGNEETENWTTNFLCNLGYGDGKGIHERAPRLDFETACKIL